MRDEIPLAVNMRITVFWDVDVLLGEWVIRCWRNSCTVIIYVCVWVGGGGGGKGGRCPVDDACCT